MCLASGIRRVQQAGASRRLGFACNFAMIRPMTASMTERPDGAAWQILRTDLPGFTWAGAAERLRHDGVCVLLLDGRALPGLPPALPEETDEARHAADGAGHLARRQACRAVLAGLTGQPAGAFSIARRASGAPFLVGMQRHVSFSARPPFSLVALGRRRLGVDIEVPVLPADIPWNMLRTDERAALQALPFARQGLAFTRLWAAKEAYAKALGQGFRLEPESLFIDARSDGRLTAKSVSAEWPRGEILTAEHRDSQQKPLIFAIGTLSSPEQSVMD